MKRFQEYFVFFAVLIAAICFLLSIILDRQLLDNKMRGLESENAKLTEYCLALEKMQKSNEDVIYILNYENTLLDSISIGQESKIKSLKYKLYKKNDTIK